MRYGMIEAGDMVVSNGKNPDVERCIGDKPHRVRCIGRMASIPFDMVWLEDEGIPYPSDGLRIVKGGEK